MPGLGLHIVLIYYLVFSCQILSPFHSFWPEHVPSAGLPQAPTLKLESSQVHGSTSCWPYIRDFIVPPAPPPHFSIPDDTVISSAGVAEGSTVTAAAEDIPVRGQHILAALFELFGRKML